MKFHPFLASAAGAILFVAAAKAESRPNFVFVLSDDVGWSDIGCHGGKLVPTPNIDSLAREGTDFQRFYVASPVCSPSRASFLTGKFPARLSIRGAIGKSEENRSKGRPTGSIRGLPRSPTSCPVRAIPPRILANGICRDDLPMRPCPRDMVSPTRPSSPGF